ncbi:hypothetical protein CYY_006476 [Polysphondylium violaceum]|uniref:Kinesin motor domain-containing protein n=1 Tax=Polysphondylium violaceum TaxID=133409 RepID=A0A8J4UY69_9MYCE|nr:hypothetical protein CYY_006476 [Polysphondylium violaceum]
MDSNRLPLSSIDLNTSQIPRPSLTRKPNLVESSPRNSIPANYKAGGNSNNTTNDSSLQKSIPYRSRIMQQQLAPNIVKKKNEQPKQTLNSSINNGVKNKIQVKRTDLKQPTNTSLTTSQLLTSTNRGFLKPNPIIKRADLDSSLIIPSNNNNEMNATLTKSFQRANFLQEQKKQSNFQVLERMGQIDQYTQSFRGQLDTAFSNLSNQFKPPRLSLSIEDIKKNLDFEEQNKLISHLQSENKRLSNIASERERENFEYSFQLSQLKTEYEQSLNDNRTLNEMIRTIQTQAELEKDKHSNVESQFQEKDRDIEILSTKLSVSQNTIEALNRQVSDLLEKSRNDEMIRRQLHNTIQELKGNIRVFCRIRPMGTGSGNSNDGAEQQPEDLYALRSDTDIDINMPVSNAVGTKGIKKLNFAFDRVFNQSSTQTMVFDEISQLVQSSLDGYNTCIFTYGQTGSGKTFTMEGSHENPELRGMIPRTVEKIFEVSNELQSRGWKYEMEAFFLEIYNETIHDLLCTKSNSSLKYDIKHLDSSTTIVSNLNTVRVSSPSQVYDLLALAAKNRSVAKTLCNERSSRSHSVFQLKITGHNLHSNEKTRGLLNLIDLAGSERLSKSGVVGDRLKETQAINKSLSSLSDVISSLANKDSHVPYRNSKLTYLLQNSLGGNSKTLMFVNISPEIKDLNESISSLRFATKVNTCEIGQAKKQKS